MQMYFVRNDEINMFNQSINYSGTSIACNFATWYLQIIDGLEGGSALSYLKILSLHKRPDVQRATTEVQLGLISNDHIGAIISVRFG